MPISDDTGAGAEWLTAPDGRPATYSSPSLASLPFLNGLSEQMTELVAKPHHAASIRASFGTRKRAAGQTTPLLPPACPRSLLPQVQSSRLRTPTRFKTARKCAEPQDSPMM